MATLEKIFTVILLVGFSALLLRIIVPFAKYFAKQLVGFAIIMVVSLGLTYGTQPFLSPVCKFIGIPFWIFPLSYCVGSTIIVWKLLADWLEK